MTRRNSTIAGQRHREQEAARRREQSRSVREIAPLPAMVNPTRRIKAKKDLKFFCEQYFPARFKLAWSSYHLQVIERLQETLIQGGGKFALAMPRGSGKTTMIETSVVWAILFGYCRFIVIIAANKEAANEIIKSIKQAITENDELLKDFPEAVYPFHRLNGSALLARGQLYLGELTNIVWKPDTVVFPKIPGSLASGATLITAGIKGAIRGKKIVMPDGSIARPDTILLDDIGTKKDAESPKLTEKLIGIIDEDVEGLVGPGEELAMLMPCTIIREGDVAWTYLNPKLKPQWRGLKFKMIEKMPDRMDLWEKYAEIRREDPVKATMFYKQNRTEMKQGAIVAWEANYTSNELDALQYAMNKWADNNVTFQCEYQNDPLQADAGLIIQSAKVIRNRLNGLEKGNVPVETYKITAFIDVHDDLLYFCVTAWTDDYTGFIIDYGTYPEQRFKEFNKGDRGLVTMKDQHGGKKENWVSQGIEFLISNLIAENYYVDGDQDGTEVMRIDRLLIDSGYLPDLIETVLRKIDQPAIVRPSFGIGVGAKKAPMSEWKAKQGELLHYGHFWSENRAETKKWRRIKIDTNYWKNYVHDAFAMNQAERGSLSLWGKSSEKHRMFAEHLNGETVQLVEVGSRKVNEWTPKPTCDNHFFDCIVGCVAAASTVGILTQQEQEKKKKKSQS
jgi:hypothetical protein